MAKGVGVCGLGSLVLVGVTFAGAGLCSAENMRKSQASTSAEGVYVLKTEAVGKHWLGISAVPIDEAMRSQLNLDQRLMVRDVVPGSPADKAGVKPHDILLFFAGKQIHGIDDLLGSVRENEDKENSLTLLRGGKQQTLQIKPEERPAESGTPAASPESKKYEDLVRNWLGERYSWWHPREPFQMRFFGPGLLDSEKARFPHDLSVSIRKQGDEPAKVSVERGQERWEASEDTLDNLPEDVRPHVERLLGRDRMAVFSLGPDGKQIEIRSEIHRRDAEAGSPRLRSEGPGKSELEELRKQLDALRKEVDKLKQNDHPQGSGKKISAS